MGFMDSDSSNDLSFKFEELRVYQKALEFIDLVYLETKNFPKEELRISRRSTRECLVCTTIARRQNFITDEKEKVFRERLVEISTMLNGLIKSIS